MKELWADNNKLLGRYCLKGGGGVMEGKEETQRERDIYRERDREKVEMREKGINESERQ